MGSLLFCAGYHHVLRETKAHFPTVVIQAIVDDTRIIGPPRDAWDAFLFSTNLAHQHCNLESVRKKCSVYSPQADLSFLPPTLPGSPSFPGSEHYPPGRLSGVEVCGVLTGDHEWVEQRLVDLVAKKTDDLRRLALVQDGTKFTNATQIQYILARYCVTAFINFTLRAHPASLTQRAALAFDAAVDDFIASLCVSAAATPRERADATRLARLPNRLGGLSLTSAVDQRIPAFLGSWGTCLAPMRRLYPHLADLSPLNPDTATTLHVLRLHTRLTKLRDDIAADYARSDASPLALTTAGSPITAFHPPGLTPANRIPTLQQMIDPPDAKFLRGAQRRFAQVFHHHRWCQVRDAAAAASPREETRVVAVAQPYCNDYLNAIPSKPAYRLLSPELRIALQRQLGLPLDDIPDGVDRYGDKLLNGTNNTTRHYHVLNKIDDMFRGSTGATWKKEPPPHDYARYSPGAKPDGVQYRAHRHTKHKLFDLKIPSPFTTSLTSDIVTPRTPLATRVAFAGTEPRLLATYVGPIGTEKLPHYHEALARGHLIVLLIIETLGGFAPGLVRTLRALAKIKSDRLPTAHYLQSWTARSFSAHHSQCIGLELRRQIAREYSEAAAAKQTH